MRSVSPSLLPALADSSFVFDGSPLWTAERGIDIAHLAGGEKQVVIALDELERAMSPAPAQWLGMRLSVLWTLFNPTREADPRALSLWMTETTHLLSDIPHDILAHSIDAAIKSSRHGFMPSVGEIRGQADPLVEARRNHIERLRKMVAALNDPVATADRIVRRKERDKRAEMDEI